MIDAITERLKLKVPELHGRIEGALALMDLIQKKRLPTQATALVFPTGLKGGKPQQATGLFIQPLSESFSVVLVLPTQDSKDRAFLATVDQRIRQIAEALAGWAPSDVPGVFRVDRGRTLSIQDGRFTYELSFSVEDQLRIQP